MSKMTIKVDNNATDILRLPCVIAAYKTPATGEIFYELTPDGNNKRFAYCGDYICISGTKATILKRNIYKI